MRSNVVTLGILHWSIPFWLPLVTLALNGHVTQGCLFTNLSVTCVMQVMWVLQAAISTNVFKNTETRLH